MRDLVFWYTGWTVWAAFALLLFGGILGAIVFAIPKFYEALQAWSGLRKLINVPTAESAEFWRAGEALRKAASAAGIEATGEQVTTWLREFNAEWRRKDNA